MARLVDLPNEVLHEISILVASDEDWSPLNWSHTSKRIQNVVLSLLLREWNPGDLYERPHERDLRLRALGLLALLLLHHPEHRNRVRRLDFDCFRINHQQVAECWPWSETRLELPPKILTALSEAAKEALPDYTKLTELDKKVQEGLGDAIVVLILAWGTRVTQVDFILPYCLTGHDEGVAKSIIFKFMGWIGSNSHLWQQEQRRSMPLVELQGLGLYAQEASLTWCECPFQFYIRTLQLPKLRTLVIEAVGTRAGLREIDYDGLSADVPQGSSAVEELLLHSMGMPGTALLDMVAACRRLRVLAYRFTAMYNTAIDKRILTKALLYHAQSLEEVVLGLHNVWGEKLRWSAHVRDKEISLERCFTRFPQLRVLNVDWRFLSGTLNVQLDARSLVEGLPGSLERLELRGPRDAEFFDLVEEAFKMLVKEAGPGRRFSKLKFLDIGSDLTWQTLPNFDEIAELCKSRGIEFPIPTRESPIPTREST